jgi:hypothetical protein
MYRRTPTGCQRRPYGRGFQTRRFLHSRSGGSLHRGTLGRFMRVRNGRPGSSRLRFRGWRGVLFDRLRFGHGHLRRGCFPLPGGLPSAALNPLPDQFRDRLVNRAGVSLFLLDAESRQHLKDLVRRNLELPRQLVDSNFTHIKKLQTPYNSDAQPTPSEFPIVSNSFFSSAEFPSPDSAATASPAASKGGSGTASGRPSAITSAASPVCSN